MAQNWSAGSPVSNYENPELSLSVAEYCGFGEHEILSVEEAPPRSRSPELFQDPLLEVAQKYGNITTYWRQDHIQQKFRDMQTELNKAESEEVSAYQRPQAKFCYPPIPLPPDTKQSFSEFTKINEYGCYEIDEEKLKKSKIEKLKRGMYSWNLDNTVEDDPAQKEINLQSLKKNVTEMLKNDEISTKQAKPEKADTAELKEEKLTEYKYERKNKLQDGKPNLRQMCLDYLLHKFGEVSFTEERLKTLQGPIYHAESILRRTAYSEVCEKHFPTEFPCSINEEDEKENPEENEPVENISMDHFEFCHEELRINFLEQFRSKDLNFDFDLENDPEINTIVPCFIKFLKEGNSKEYTENCITIILAILKNPYRKLDIFLDDELPVVREQMAMAEYLVNCLLISEIHDGEDVYEKLMEALIIFANIHSSFLAHIKAGLEGISYDDKNMAQRFQAYQTYCKVLNLLISLGATVIGLCLPHHFEKISCLASADANCDLYFLLLRACEISIAHTIEDSWGKYESSDDSLVKFFTASYNYFGRDLTTRLISVFKNYEKKKDREERYLTRKYDIYPSKLGYTNLDIDYLMGYTIRPESEPPKLPSVNESPFNSAGKVCFSNTQFGYLIQEDMHELPAEDMDYCDSIKNFPISYLNV